jgi:hypothetical protein
MEFDSSQPGCEVDVLAPGMEGIPLVARQLERREAIEFLVNEWIQRFEWIDEVTDVLPLGIGGIEVRNSGN